MGPRPRQCAPGSETQRPARHPKCGRTRRPARGGRTAAEGARSLGRSIAKIRGEMSAERIGLVVVARSGLGVLHELTGVIARHQGDIASVEIIEERPPESRIYFEIDLPEDPLVLQSDLEKLEIVRQVQFVKTFQKIYGKRIIIVGGGAQ